MENENISLIPIKFPDEASFAGVTLGRHATLQDEHCVTDSSNATQETSW